MRQKAFTLFARAYDDARRAVLYLRAEHGDADDIAPSLYAGRGGSRRRADPPPSDGQTPPSTPPDGDETPDSGTLPIDNSAGLPVTKPFAT